VRTGSTCRGSSCHASCWPPGPAAEIPGRIGQAVEALDLVPLLAHALQRAQIDAPVTDALNRLISGELPLDDWVARVRATVPPPARFESVVAWARRRQRTKARFTRRRGSS
jgi:glycerol-3-phosphate dehydrogenase (NAD(P)+)